jgi:choline dehydrogenase-like flavoprotein
MIADLAQASGTAGPGACDVTVVGAGIAGCLLACELARRGRSVLLLESGGLAQTEDLHPLNRVVQTAQIYYGAEQGRYRCLGGTSTRWGGALIPFLAEDFASPLPGCTGQGGTAWPVGPGDLSAHLARAEQVFDLPSGGYELEGEPATSIPVRPARSEAGATFILRAPKWPAFGRRNIATQLGAQLRAPEGPQVWLHATVTALKLSAGGRVDRVEIRSSCGVTFSVPIKELIIAAGAIESTRILLQLDADHDDRLFAGAGVIGRYFHDHLSAPVARLTVHDAARLARLAGFRFQGSGMRNTRFELSGAARRAQQLPAAFAHIGFSTVGPSGFDALREIYRALQRREPPHTRNLSLLARHLPWLLRAGWSRFIRRRVLAPDDANYELHLVTEQIPDARNRILLNATERDVFGRLLAQIEWRVLPQDLDNSERVLGALLTFWRARGLEEIATLDPYEGARRSASLAGSGGIYHPGGTLRMGRSPATGIVDKDLRVFGVPNLRVVSTAAFPSGGGANPTLMLMLFALRAVDDLHRDR